jgi:hypothetical protein
MERLYALGVVKERSIPDPAALGHPQVLFASAELFADRIEEATESWRAETSALHLLAAPERLFGVFVSRDSAHSAALRDRLNNARSVRSTICLECDSRNASVPVFFDFEEAWVRTTGLPGVVRYPRPLPSSTASEQSNPIALDRQDRRILEGMLSRPFVPGPKAGLFTRLRRFPEEARERRLQKDGVIEFRTLLDPVACAGWSESFPQSMVSISGTLLGGRTPKDFFYELIREAGVAPFLYATNASQVLFQYLSLGVRTNAEDSPSVVPPIVPIVRRSLEGVVVMREDLSGVKTVIDHRYDRPFGIEGLSA